MKSAQMIFCTLLKYKYKIPIACSQLGLKNNLRWLLDKPERTSDCTLLDTFGLMFISLSCLHT